MDYRGRMQRNWEAMESCRAGTDDLSHSDFAELAAQLAGDPELHTKFQRLQRADAVIKAAYRDVPIPTGLADRLSLRLAGAQPQAEAQPETTAAKIAPLRKQTGRFSRRRLLVGFTALAAAAGLLAAVWIETHQPRHDTPSSVLDEAMDLFGRDNQPVGDLVTTVPPPAAFPISPDIVRLRDVRWRQVKGFLGGSAVVYDLPTAGGRATLYVAQRTVAGLPSCPPFRPVLSTGGRSAAAWQVGDTLYVLVVDAAAGPYASYLDQSHGPLT
jgi:hypothetical protein